MAEQQQQTKHCEEMNVRIYQDREGSTYQVTMVQLATVISFIGIQLDYEQGKNSRPICDWRGKLIFA